MNNNSFLVLLAAHNGLRFVEQQINSILYQQNVHVDILVNIDKSHDGTDELLLKLAHSDPRIKLLPTGYQYGSAASNFYHLFKSSNFSKYDFIALSDQDDIWLSNKLSRARDIILNESVDAYSSDVTAFWENGNESYIRKSYPQRKWDYLFEAPGPGCTFVFSNHFANELQNFIIKNSFNLSKIESHDWFFYAYARSKNYKWKIDEFSSLNYRQHSNNQIGVNLGFKAAYKRLKLIITGWFFSQSILIANLLGICQNSFVSSWINGNRIGFLLLAFNCHECRRSIKDRFFFFFSCLMIFFLGFKKK